MSFKELRFYGGSLDGTVNTVPDGKEWDTFKTAVWPPMDIMAIWSKEKLNPLSTVEYTTETYYRKTYPPKEFLAAGSSSIEVMVHESLVHISPELHVQPGLPPWLEFPEPEKLKKAGWSPLGVTYDETHLFYVDSSPPKPTPPPPVPDWMDEFEHDLQEMKK